MRRSAAVALAAVAPVVAVLVGCGAEQAAGDDAAMVDCGGSVYDAGTVPLAPSVSTLPSGPAGAVDDMGAPAFDPALDWSVVHQEADRVDLLRALDEPIDNGGGDVRTHESRSLERISGSTNVPDGTWLLTSAGPCAQRLVGDDRLGAADVTLASGPAPDASTLSLMVLERECASGRDAEGRIEVVRLEETPQQVRLWVAVEEPGGAQTCPMNPGTPLTIELAEPLGDREVVDVSVVPPRPVAVAEAG